MKQQTAVEWLAIIYHHRQGYLSLEDIAQAKEMEKWQIKDAYFEGRCDWRKPYAENMEKAEKYYNVTYKK